MLINSVSSIKDSKVIKTTSLGFYLKEMIWSSLKEGIKINVLITTFLLSLAFKISDYELTHWSLFSDTLF